MPFHDAALDGRSVPVRFRPDHKRSYEEYSDDDPWIVKGAELARNMEFVLPSVAQPPGVAARIFNTYSPLLSVAQLCGDDDFAKEISRRLQQETLELKEAQGEEPDGLVLRAIVEAIFLHGKPEFAYIKFSALAESIYRNHKFTLQPRQIGPFARELGFETKPSHGVTVVVPTPATLLKACEECDYTDEGIEQLRREMVGGTALSTAPIRAKLFS
jgi:hypothetical protein